MKVRTALTLLCLTLACARPMAPPGGERDQEAPRVLSTMPEHRAVVTGFDDEVEFRFDETLGEKGATQDAVIVSPETGRATLERDGSDLKVRIEGGWKPDQVYRVVIRPGIQDRFGNARREPAEVVFSTGPELIPTAIAGVVTDRLTERPLADTRVIALSIRDSVRHVTVTDTSGFFGLRFLPLGRYEITAFEDRNRNGLPDRTERRGDRAVLVTTVRDTVTVELAVLAPDTTP